MLKSWTLENFKSIATVQSLSLTPLTLFTGANNSGKSSFLQSVLVVAQTLRNTLDSPPLIVDGELFRGDVSELIHTGAKSFAFAFEADVSLTRFRNPAVQDEASTLQVQCRFNISGGPDKRAALQACGISVFDSHHEPIGSVRVERRARSWTGKMGSRPPAWLDKEVFSYRIAGDGDGAGETLGVGLWHFLPQYVVVRRDARLEAYADMIRLLLRLVPRDISRESRETQDLAVEAARIILSDPSLTSIAEIGPRRRSAIRQLPTEQIPRQLAPLFEPFKNDVRWRRRPVAGPLEGAVASLRTLGGTVRYVGPLRVPPQFVYASAPDLDDGSVGASGEYAVAQLYRNRLTRVEYVNPSTGAIEFSPLIAAVEAWLRHLGVLDRVYPWYRPKVGHYLWVQAPGGPSGLDLTSVGVGASQVLPVLVQSLLAPRGSVLLFEQPELHLHPKVQSRLGDFFLAVARTGRQCLVETHSEHIVDRIRLRIAEAPGRDVLDLASIYFAKRETDATIFERIEVNEYGVLADWPDGFFDETQSEAGRILSASVAKRRQTS